MPFLTCFVSLITRFLISIDTFVVVKLLFLTNGIILYFSDEMGLKEINWSSCSHEKEGISGKLMDVYVIAKLVLLLKPVVNTMNQASSHPSSEPPRSNLACEPKGGNSKTASFLS